MEPQIRHKRLHAFFQSKVLNSLMIVGEVALLLTGYLESLTLPVVCASIAFVLFIVYSLWIWIGQPRSIVINNVLSNASGLLTLYFLIIAACSPVNPWWFAVPAIGAIVLMFVCMIKPTDEIFEIY